ncbi:MAG TPA: helix-turn-helix transcriptional regulator [Euzebyales bacterium]|nr:helix-turn-helix transcriptional regulator [Euzebyales bacterium]
MRRKPNTLLPLEADILNAGMALQRRGARQFYGFQLAKQLADAADARRLTAHGTLYKALGRLDGRGLLASTWEDPQVAADAGRPRRRLYEVTGAGERALAQWRIMHDGATVHALRRGLEPT